MHQQIIEGYNHWAKTYDSQENKTRDVEAICLQELMAYQHFNLVAEIGCGTGKNTAFLQSICKKLIALDASAGMLAIAQQKVKAPHVHFVQSNLEEQWPLADAKTDAAIFSLVLEHIQNLSFPFAEAARILRQGGLLYVGELHPFKQYLGSVARFEAGNNTVHLPAYQHHLSEYFGTARENGFILINCLEKTAAGDEVPRVLAMLFKKI